MLRNLYNAEGGRYRESNLYDFMYEKNKLQNAELKERLADERKFHAQGSMYKNVKYYKNFVRQTDKLINKMKVALQEGSDFNQVNKELKTKVRLMNKQTSNSGEIGRRKNQKIDRNIVMVKNGTKYKLINRLP